MTLFLVRHARAASRLFDPIQDFLRPLDPSGIAQAEAIAVELASRPVGSILSSPAKRCVETVEPLAKALGLEIAITDELAEAVSTNDTVTLLHSLAQNPSDSVLSSHGDVIPTVLWGLAESGVHIPDRHRCKKASIWELVTEDGTIKQGLYHHPETFGADISPH